MRSVAPVVPLLPSLLLFVTIAAVAVLAKPDCNACFMKSAGRDRNHGNTADTTTHTPQQRPAVGGEVPISTSAIYVETGSASQRLSSQFRLKRTAGWEQEVQNRLREVLFAKNAEQMKARAEAESGDAVSGQWWEEAPWEPSAADVEWPPAVSRDAWGELGDVATQGQRLGQGLGGPGLQRGFGADTAAPAADAGAGVWGNVKAHALRA